MLETSLHIHIFLNVILFSAKSNEPQDWKGYATADTSHVGHIKITFELGPAQFKFINYKVISFRVYPNGNTKRLTTFYEPVYNVSIILCNNSETMYT